MEINLKNVESTSFVHKSRSRFLKSIEIRGDKQQHQQQQQDNNLN